MTETDFRPAGPGFHRRIRTFPFPDRIVVGLEDNLHFFVMTMRHDNGKIVDLTIHSERYPWTICSGSAEFLKRQLIGGNLRDIQHLEILQNCTHLFELAIMCANHCHDQRSSQFDLHVDEWRDNKTRSRLLVDDRVDLDLSFSGVTIATPGAWFGQDVFQLARSETDLAPLARERIMLIARSVYVSLGRSAPVVERAVDRGSRIVGVCYAYQPARIDEAVRMPHSRKEFAGEADAPLAGFDPQRFFGAA